MSTKEEIIQRTKERSRKYQKTAKFLLNKGLKTKDATCFNTRITYFRGITYLKKPFLKIQKR